jgi:KaiC/GvpD/RAD55 family RecA-like ATPase
MLHSAGADEPGTVVISVVSGMAGVGKTALAVHGTHQAAARFPDGQLYVNLRGFAPSDNLCRSNTRLR